MLAAAVVFAVAAKYDNEQVDLINRLNQRKELEKLDVIEGDVAATHHANLKLRRLIDDATRDRNALEQTLRLVDNECRRTGDMVAAYRQRIAELQEEMKSIPQPQDWPHRQ